MNDENVEIVFVVDGKRLEAQACLLAPTLKFNLTRQQKAVAYVREDYVESVDALTFEVLDAAAVEVRLITKTIGHHEPWTSPYPQGNKILALAQPRSCDVTVFMDTDMILAEPVDFAKELGDADIGACISDYSTFGATEEAWSAFYGCFGLSLPSERVTLQAGRRLEALPYYNAGMVILREQRDGLPTEIGKEWLELAQKFDHQVKSEYNRSNIDQLTLPILGYKRGTPVKAMCPRLNFNIQAHGLGEGRAQSVAHYHTIGVLWAHQNHARFALNCLSDLCGADAIHRVLQRFQPHMKRKRLKRLIEL